MVDRALRQTEWPLLHLDGLELIQSPLLMIKGLKHAFTTRIGAATPEPLNWFNLGRHLDEDHWRADAMKNREILADALGLDAADFTVPGQRHTTNIYMLREGDKKGLPLQSYDGVATVATNHPILLHFADCVPVMLIDTRKRALCVMHAGWRGTAGGIVTKGVQLLTASLGCDPADMIAAVGPAIGACCYETGEEVAEQLLGTVADPEAGARLVERRNGKPFPNLKAFNALQLYEAGVGEVDVSAWCTACHPDLFYSHRQSGGMTGRQGALACLL